MDFPPWKLSKEEEVRYVLAAPGISAAATVARDVEAVAAGKSRIARRISYYLDLNKRSTGILGILGLATPSHSR